LIALEHLLVLPVLLPLATAALMLLGDRNRGFKAVLNVVSAARRWTWT